MTSEKDDGGKVKGERKNVINIPNSTFSSTCSMELFPETKICNIAPMMAIHAKLSSIPRKECIKNRKITAPIIIPSISQKRYERGWVKKEEGNEEGEG